MVYEPFLLNKNEIVIELSLIEYKINILLGYKDITTYIFSAYKPMSP